MIIAGQDTRDYIGDGVYADFDGFAITLSTERMDNGTNWIALEPNVLQALDRYRERMKALVEAERAEAKP